MAQWIRKSQPTPGDVHINGPLTNISVAFLQSAEAFVAGQAFPNIPVVNQSDAYFTFDRGMFNRDQMKRRAPGAESAEIGYSVSNDTYACDVWALHHDIPDQRRANADSPLQSDREAVELLTRQAMVRQEAQWVADFFATSIWTTDLTGVTATPTSSQFLQWDQSGSDPVADVELGKTTVGEGSGFEPNLLVLDRQTWRIIRNHPDILDRIKFSGNVGPNNAAIVNLQTIAQVFDVERVLVSKAIQNTAAEGATNVHSYILGKNALLLYAAPSPGLMTPSAGYTFSWTGFTGAASNGQRINKLRAPLLASDRVEIEMAFDHKVVSADLGYFFSGTVA